MANLQTTWESLPDWLRPEDRWALQWRWFVFGILASRILSFVSPIEIGEMAIHLSMFAYVAAFILVPMWMFRSRLGINGPELAIWSLSAGILIDELGWLVVREHGHSTWTWGGLLAPIGLGSAYLLIAWMSSRWQPSAHQRLDQKWLMAFIVIQLILFFTIRIQQEVLRADGIPNEERSLMLNGYEVHHIVTGTVLFVIATLMIITPPVKEAFFVAFVLAAIGLQFAADEWSYYFMEVVDDAAYFSSTSWIGAIIAETILICSAWWALNQQMESEQE